MIDGTRRGVQVPEGWSIDDLIRQFYGDKKDNIVMQDGYVTLDRYALAATSLNDADMYYFRMLRE